MGMEPLAFLGIEDAGDSMFTQAALQAAERAHEKVLDSLAGKIRNQIADMLKGN
jgi:hypothetical protein